MQSKNNKSEQDSINISENMDLNKEEIKAETAENLVPESENQSEDTVGLIEKENQELKDKYLRLYSDFENYKRRTNKERIELFQMAGQDILKSLLPVLDDFDRAEKSLKTTSDISSISEGLKLVSSKLLGTLEQKGLQSYNTIGEVFDADVHEAISKIPASSKNLKGKVVDEIEKGYKLHSKVIRFAKVIVGE